MATPSSNFASATARSVREVRYATSRDVVISTTSVRASSASRSKIWTPPSADTVNVGPAAQTDVGIVKATIEEATFEKANVTASPIIVLGISEASLERGNGMRTTRLSQSYTYSQLLQQRSRHYAANSGAENTRLHDERKTESNRRGNWAIGVTSAFPQKAEARRTSRHFAFVPETEVERRALTAVRISVDRARRRSASDTSVQRLALTISDFAVWCANPPNDFV